jgi:Na+/H+ antiporter NhaD/arsenite permease-like protein
VIVTALVGGLLGHHDAPHAKPVLPDSWALGAAPFAFLLLAIATFPLIPALAGWWHSNVSRLAVAATCGVATLAWITTTMGAQHAATLTGHAVLDEYIPFIVLLFSLYVISGGILIAGDIPGNPRINTAILALGTILANVLGTTGASMLLIRPILRANRRRAHRAHVVIFFIFLVSNCGGLLLPIGDPPLFLGYLRGVPFTWTMQLVPEWMVVTGALLVIFFAVDTAFARKEGSIREPADLVDDDPTPNVRVTGGRNVVWLAGVVLAAAFLVPGTTIESLGWTVLPWTREAVMLACAGLSLWLTPWPLREENHFAFGPIIEVAAIFSGLFVAMQPALAILGARGGELGVTTPAQFFWATGILSSFLDNAPTYLVFADVASTMTPADAAETVTYGTGRVAEPLLVAVSLGAVFMGANTYIGNGPNLMVAAIARRDGVPMPSFFGYMLWSGALLLPLFGVVTWLFLA